MSKRLIAAAGLLAGSVCISMQASADDTCKADFRRTVQPILNSNCVACHQDAAAASGLSLQRTSAPGSLIAIPSQETSLALVTPGDPSKSYFFRKITGTHQETGGIGERMPLGGELPAEDIKAIENWIATCKVDG